MSTTTFLIPLGLATGAVSLILSLYLAVQCRRQKSTIDKLQVQAKNQSEEYNLLLERIRSAVQPQFAAVGVSINESINRIDIKLQNLGAPAILEKVVTSTPDIEFLDDRFFPARIETEDLFIVTGISKGLALAQCRYVVQLHFSDTHGNHYITAIRGEGQEFSVTTHAKG
jgi:hypothetical protein